MLRTGRQGGVYKATKARFDSAARRSEASAEDAEQQWTDEERDTLALQAQYTSQVFPTVFWESPAHVFWPDEQQKALREQFVIKGPRGGSRVKRPRASGVTAPAKAAGEEQCGAEGSGEQAEQPSVLSRMQLLAKQVIGRLTSGLDEKWLHSSLLYPGRDVLQFAEYRRRLHNLQARQWNAALHHLENTEVQMDLGVPRSELAAAKPVLTAELPEHTLHIRRGEAAGSDAHEAPPPGSVQLVQQCLAAGVVPTLDMLHALKDAAAQPLGGQGGTLAPLSAHLPGQLAQQRLQQALEGIDSSSEDGTDDEEGVDVADVSPAGAALEAGGCVADDPVDTSMQSAPPAQHAQRRDSPRSAAAGNLGTTGITEHALFTEVDIGVLSQESAAAGAGDSHTPQLFGAARDQGMFGMGPLHPPDLLAAAVAPASDAASVEGPDETDLLEALDQLGEGDMQELLAILGEGGDECGGGGGDEQGHEGHRHGDGTLQVAAAESNAVKHVRSMLAGRFSAAPGGDIAARVRQALARQAARGATADTAQLHKQVRAAMLPKPSRNGRKAPPPGSLGQLVQAVQAAQTATETKQPQVQCSEQAVFMSLLLLAHDENRKPQRACIQLRSSPGGDVIISAEPKQ